MTQLKTEQTHKLSCCVIFIIWLHIYIVLCTGGLNLLINCYLQIVHYKEAWLKLHSSLSKLLKRDLKFYRFKVEFSSNKKVLCFGFSFKPSGWGSDIRSRVRDISVLLLKWYFYKIEFLFLNLYIYRDYRVEPSLSRHPASNLLFVSLKSEISWQHDSPW